MQVPLQERGQLASSCGVASPSDPASTTPPLLLPLAEPLLAPSSRRPPSPLLLVPEAPLPELKGLPDVDPPLLDPALAPDAELLPLLDPALPADAELLPLLDPALLPLFDPELPVLLASPSPMFSVVASSLPPASLLAASLACAPPSLGASGRPPLQPTAPERPNERIAAYPSCVLITMPSKRRPRRLLERPRVAETPGQKYSCWRPMAR